MQTFPYDAVLFDLDGTLTNSEQGILCSMITASATAYDITTDRPNVFRTCFLDPFQGKVMADFTSQELKATKVAAMYKNGDDYSVGLKDAFVAEAKTLGMGSITGSIIAASVLTLLPELLREFSDYRMLLYSIILIVMMLFRPKGLMGTAEFSLTFVWNSLFGWVRKLLKIQPKVKDTPKAGLTDESVKAGREPIMKPKNTAERWLNPVMITLIYLVLGFFFNLWHPGWMIFLAIPVAAVLNGKPAKS